MNLRATISYYVRTFTGFFILFSIFLGIFGFVSILSIFDLTIPFYVPALTVQTYLYFFVKARLPFMLPFIVFLMLNIGQSSKLSKVFSWKVWCVPAITVTAISIVVNLDNLFGFDWYWPAIATWTTLFLAQLYLYQRSNIPKQFGLLLSFLGICVASDLYEFPFIGTHISLINFLSPLAYIGLFGFLLWNFKVHIDKILVLTLVPIFVEWILYYGSLFDYPWVKRAMTIPLLVYLAYRSTKR